MNYIIILILAVLFTIPDTRLFGFTSGTLFLGSLFLFYLLFIKYKIPKEFIRFNLPFIFLLVFSILILLIKIPEYNSIDISYVFARNRDLFSELFFILILYFLIFRSDDKLKVIRYFIEIYFILNALYYILKLTNKSVILFFHQSINKVYTFSNFEIGRESFLGWEPSYTVPLSILFCLVYIIISTNKIYTVLILVFTVIIFLLGLSKTSFIMLFIIGISTSYFYLNNHLLNKKIIKTSVIIIFLMTIMVIINYLENTYGIFSFNSSDKTEQYKIISFLTRSQLIFESINQFVQFPFGYGLGNSIIIMSNYIDNNVMNFMTSYEILESTKYTRTPKSQLLEYFLSGGILFIILFVLHLRYINKKIKEIDDYKTKQQISLIEILLLTTILLGERIPYILIINLLLIISIILKEQKGTNK